MAASANPGGHSNVSNGGNSNGGGAEKANGGVVSGPENSAVEPTQGVLRHNPGISLDWTAEEQSTLEDLLAKYASESTLVCYSIIAQALRDKTVRDVAFRCRWMTKKENGKRRKDDNGSSRKNKDKKEKVTDPLPKSSQGANRTNGPPYAQSIMSMDSDDGIPSNAIGGATGQLLEHNAQALEQIAANFSACKVFAALISSIHENMALFCRTRDNIISVLNNMGDGPPLMKQMPPFPVKLNELANSFLPRTPPYLRNLDGDLLLCW